MTTPNLEDINTELELALKSVTGLPQFQKENTKFTMPAPSIPWCRATLLTSANEPIANDMDSAIGIYVVDLFYPSDTGTVAARTLANAICEQFVRGELFNMVYVEASHVEPGRDYQSRYQLPVRVNWRVDFKIRN